MNNSAVKIISSLFFAIILAVGAAQTQAQVSQRTFEAQIPFDFIAGAKTYSAGKYLVRVINLDSIPILTFENKETHDWKQMHVRTNGSRSEMDKTVLIFDRYGDKLVFSQMIAPNFGLNSLQFKRNKQLAKKFGKSDHTVAVVLKNNSRNGD